jgi:hypothetical protein
LGGGGRAHRHSVCDPRWARHRQPARRRTAPTCPALPSPGPRHRRPRLSSPPLGSWPAGAASRCPRWTSADPHPLCATTQATKALSKKDGARFAACVRVHRRAAVSHTRVATLRAVHLVAAASARSRLHHLCRQMSGASLQATVPPARAAQLHSPERPRLRRSSRRSPSPAAARVTLWATSHRSIV